MASQATIDTAQAQVVLAEDALERAEAQFRPYENKPESNLIRANLLTRLAAAEQTYDAAVRQLNALLGTGNLTDITVAEADFATATAELLQVQREWERLKDGPSLATITLLGAQLAYAQREWER